MPNNHALPGVCRVVALCLCPVALPLLHAQDGGIVDRSRAPFRDAVPEPDSVGSSSPRLPDPAPVAEADPTPLGVRVRGLRLVASQDRVSAAAAIDGEAAVAAGEGVNLPGGLAQALEEEFLGKDVSLALLQEISTAIIKAYRASDYPLVDVYLPEQDITAGKIQLVVREAVLGEVRVEGAKHSNPDRLVRQIRIKAGERVNSRILERDVEWLNESPARSVDLIYERGQSDGTSDIVIRTNDLQAIRAHVGYGNTGINSTGQTEWNAGLAWSNVFGTDQIASYAFGGDADLDNLNAHSLVYRIPLPWRHQIDLLGAYVVSSTDDADEAFPFGVDGESIQASAGYRIPLPRYRPSWRNDLVLGWDYKSTNSDILFGGDSVFASSAQVFQFRVGYELTVPDDWGSTTFDIGFTYSPGDVLQDNTDEAFSALRADAPANYGYLSASAQRSLRLPAGFGFVFRADGQYTDDRLISTEQVLAGGWLTVRGFDENLARADSGLILNSQLLLPTPPALSDLIPGEEELSVYLFQDSGFLRNSGSAPGETNPSLHSAGLGMEWRAADRFSLRGSYGWNLGDSGLGEVEDGKFHFGLSLRY